MMFKMICGFIPPSSGKIYVNDKIIGKDTDIPDDLGVIIESSGFLPNYDGFHNLKFLAAIRRIIGNEQVHETIRIVGLDPESKKHEITALQSSL